MAPTHSTSPGPANEPLLQFFDHYNIGEGAHEWDAAFRSRQTIAQVYSDLAMTIVGTLPRNPERTTALRKLLESRDCALRAIVMKGA